MKDYQQRNFQDYILFFVSGQFKDNLLISELQNAGYKIRVVTHWDELMITIEAASPLLILLNQQGDEFNGLEIIQKLQSDVSTNSISVIFINYSADEAIRAKAFELGCADFISLPVQTAEMLSKVKKHSQFRKMQYQLEELENIGITQDELRESRELNMAILQETIPYGMDIVDEEGTILFQNENFKKLFANETVGKKCWMVYRDDKQQCKSCPLHAGVPIGTTITIESVGVLNGKSFHVSHTGMMFHGKKAVLEIFQDITERKRAQELLSQSEKRYHTLFNNILDGVLLANPDGVIFAANEAASIMFGRTEEEIIKAGRNGLVDIHDPRIQSFLEERERTSKARGELNLLRHDGTIFNAYVSSQIFDIALGVKMASIVIRDITESKKGQELLVQSEKRYHALFNNSLDGVLLTSPDGGIIAANEAACKMLGRTEQEIQDVGRNGVVDMTDPRISGYLEERRRTGILIGELIMIRKDGSKFPVDISSKVFEISKGIQVTSMVVRDITERKQAEENLLRLNNQLKELNFTKDKLFSIVAHDLKNPFAGILGFADILQENIEKKEYEYAEKHLDFIITSAKQALALLDNLLTWAKSQTGQLHFKPEKLNLHICIYEIVEFLSMSAKLKNISLHFTQTDKIMVNADLNMLQTILRNLITNAIKFTYEGGEINIQALTRENEAEVIISDSGVGMSKPLIEKLFDVETNITTFGTANEKGSGLGLILCREFVEKHGGKIWVESEPEKGSAFHFSIPKINKS